MNYEFKISPLDPKKFKKRAREAHKTTQAMLMNKDVQVKATITSSYSLNLQMLVGRLPINLNFKPTNSDLQYARVSRLNNGDCTLKINGSQKWEALKHHIELAMAALSISPANGMVTVQMSEAVKSALGLIQPKSKPCQPSNKKNKKVKHNNQNKANTMAQNTTTKTLPTITKSPLVISTVMGDQEILFQVSTGKPLVCIKPTKGSDSNSGKWTWHNMGSHMPDFSNNLVTAIAKSADSIRTFFFDLGINVRID